MKILLIEDEMELQMSIKHYLEPEGNIVEIASDYRKALQKIVDYQQSEKSKWNLRESCTEASALLIRIFPMSSRIMNFMLTSLPYIKLLKKRGSNIATLLSTE